VKRKSIVSIGILAALLSLIFISQAQAQTFTVSASYTPSLGCDIQLTVNSSSPGRYVVNVQSNSPPINVWHTFPASVASSTFFVPLNSSYSGTVNLTVRIYNNSVTSLLH
jgi:hypothetical protein